MWWYFCLGIAILLLSISSSPLKCFASWVSNPLTVPQCEEWSIVIGMYIYMYVCSPTSVLQEPHIQTSPNFLFMLPMLSFRFSVIFWQCCSMLSNCCFVGDVIFAYNRLNGIKMLVLFFVHLVFVLFWDPLLVTCDVSIAIVIVIFAFLKNYCILKLCLYHLPVYVAAKWLYPHLVVFKWWCFLLRIESTVLWSSNCPYYFVIYFALLCALQRSCWWSCSKTTAFIKYVRTNQSRSEWAGVKAFICH